MSKFLQSIIAAAAVSVTAWAQDSDSWKTMTYPEMASLPNPHSTGPLTAIAHVNKDVSYGGCRVIGSKEVQELLGREKPLKQIGNCSVFYKETPSKDIAGRIENKCYVLYFDPKKPQEGAALASFSVKGKETALLIAEDAAWNTLLFLKKNQPQQSDQLSK